MPQVRGKIARIIDERTLIINVGQQHGVTSGMRFVIYEEGDQILDPDSGESLGAWEVVKGEVVARHVQERISVVETPPSEATPTSAPVSSLMAEVSKGRVQEPGRLNVSRADLSGRPQVGPIAVGDSVRSMD